MPSLKKNVLYQSAYQVLLMLAPLVTAPYVSRVLGPEGVGLNSWTNSIAQYFVLVAMLGIVTHGGRSIARVRSDRAELNRAFSELITAHLVTSALSLVAYISFVLAFTDENQMIFAIQGLWIVAAALDVNWLLSGLEQFGTLVARNTVVKLATIAAVFVFVRTSEDTWILVTVLALGAALGQVSVWPFLRHHVTFQRPAWPNVAQHIKPMLVLFIPSIAISFYRVTSRVMLGAFANEIEVGYFANAEKLAGIAVGLITAFTAVMLPRITHLVAMGNEADVKRLMTTTFRYVLMLSFALAFGLAAVAPEFTPVFFGADFLATAPLAVGMSVTIPFMALAAVIRTQCLVPRSLDRQFIASLFCGAAVSIVANVLLIPAHGAAGAVIAMALAEITVCAVQVASVRTLIPIWAYVRPGAFFIPAGLTMYLAVRGLATLASPGIPLVTAQVAVGALLYSTASILYLWRKQDTVLVSLVQRIKNKT